ncbi:polyprenyl synthetase family protein [Saccharopolyspora phatthalungensis]|uniref:Heptaprenyl diphosphate synthase n=1 Tax=Saccharopolyspora phatthalungensis TaxID=664693 RepID=A0A840PWN3_9PSEU|nr:polyprenyl synthetase family protein [Saccharopolyspora phatthalungensis]MBB5154692.1 heptaprenyl diphosphate synthase [Saccharopolyspora phatthalungensis]
MSRPAGDPISELTTGGSGGIAIADEALADSVRRGMARVERLLHDSVQSEFKFATRTSLHLVEAGGKRFRPLFTLLAAQFGDPTTDEVIKSAAVVEMIHLATLYHDDVMDEATMRRGATSANARWDNSVAILTGDFLFAQASRLIADLGAAAVRRMASTFEALVTGQMRETVGVAADEDAVEFYLKVIYEKTGSLIATAGRFGAWFSGADEAHTEALERIGRILGTAFQISDDIIDIASPAKESGKTPGTDLREGVRTLPMLYALTDADTGTRLRELLDRPLTSDPEVDEALGLLRASNGLARTRATLDEYADNARKELASLPDVAAREALSTLVDYVVARTR